MNDEDELAKTVRAHFEVSRAVLQRYWWQRPFWLPTLYWEHYRLLRRDGFSVWVALEYASYFTRDVFLGPPRWHD